MAEAGTYKWNCALNLPKATHWDIASRLLTDSAVSTSTTPTSLAAALLKDEVRVPGQRTRPDGRRLLVADVDGDVELSLVLRLEQANDPIVLELLADRPHEDGAQYNLRREGLDDATTANIPGSAREYSTSPAGIPGI